MRGGVGLRSPLSSMAAAARVAWSFPPSGTSAHCANGLVPASAAIEAKVVPSRLIAPWERARG